MTPTPLRTPRRLLVITMLLALTGLVLLAWPSQQPVSSPRTPDAAGPTTRYPSASPTPGSISSRAVSPRDAPAASALPPHGEGRAGDPGIQQALENAWPVGLPADDERHLLAAGRALLRADATGIGRDRWPSVFSDSGRAVAPAFTRFRIQAAIARQDGAPSRAVVHLVWAAADRGGTYTDGRITVLSFTRTSQKGASPWTPQPRT
ncbi:hypothetical protein ACWCXB_30065 [Streptomyces sp. NPDC001514]